MQALVTEVAKDESIACEGSFSTACISGLCICKIQINLHSRCMVICRFCKNDFRASYINVMLHL